MPGLSLQGTVATEIQLAPKERVQLLRELKLWAQKKAAIKKLEAEAKELNAKIEALREESGLDTFEIDGYNVTLVAPVRSVLNEKRLIALGCKAEWITKAVEQVPSTPYTKITVPK